MIGFCLIFLSERIAHADPAAECDGNSQVEIGLCVEETLKRVDVTIDAYLGFAQEAAKELDAATGRDEAVPALNASQLAWASYRDRHCEYIGSTYGGGSGTGIAVRSCRIILGRERARELRSAF